MSVILSLCGLHLNHVSYNFYMYSTYGTAVAISPSVNLVELITLDILTPRSLKFDPIPLKLPTVVANCSRSDKIVSNCVPTLVNAVWKSSCTEE